MSNINYYMEITWYFDFSNIKAYIRGNNMNKNNVIVNLNGMSPAGSMHFMDAVAGNITNVNECLAIVRKVAGIRGVALPDKMQVAKCIITVTDDYLMVYNRMAEFVFTAINRNRTNMTIPVRYNVHKQCPVPAESYNLQIPIDNVNALIDAAKNRYSAIRQDFI